MNDFADFAWTAENAAQVERIIGRYPPGRQASAIMPLLDLAQRQIGAATNSQGWLPVPVIEFVAREIGVPYIRAYEVATFYTMFMLEPVGKTALIRALSEALHLKFNRIQFTPDLLPADVVGTQIYQQQRNEWYAFGIRPAATAFETGIANAAEHQQSRDHAQRHRRITQLLAAPA